MIGEKNVLRFTCLQAFYTATVIIFKRGNIEVESLVMLVAQPEMRVTYVCIYTEA